MHSVLLLFLAACALPIASCDHDFSAYAFNVTLNTEEEGGLYELYWTFDNDAETIDFAVRVQTSGWVGFGLSPNGQMPNSDVVIGWVTDGGETVFHDRFATGRAPPAIDESQDWILKSGEEDGEFTILEFSRNYITCDDKDLPVNAETARVIWSFNDVDPVSEVLSFADRHSNTGGLSLNLLGGLPSRPPEPDDLQFYDVNVDSVIIPQADTTYWCAAFRLPEDIRSQTRYITRFGPIVTEGNEAKVHHLLVYLCDGLNDTHVGSGGICDGEVADEVTQCRGGLPIAAWAVGGEDFFYPENVALPFGGEGSPEYLVMELHYDNPNLRQGTVDSSGIRFWYTSTPREHDAGILQFGHFVQDIMVIPPGADNFTITAIGEPQCTSKFPEEGIHVFANILHTHVVGHGLVVQHFRKNFDCDVYEELEPIDRNLQYDFNYQQVTHLRREVTILPGDIIQLKCFYRTTDVDTVTLGGESTREEMCFTFPFYYPRMDEAIIQSRIIEEDLEAFLDNYNSGESDQASREDRLNAIDWDVTAIKDLQATYNNGTYQYFCGGVNDDSRRVFGATTLTENSCPYIAPDQCTDSTIPTCCERIKGEGENGGEEEDDREVEDGGVIPKATLTLLLALSLLATILE